jgi:hypothetical protein
MQAAFQKQRDFVYTLKINLPYSCAEIIKELIKEDWQTDIAGYTQDSFPTRYRLKMVTQPRLKEIEQYVERGEFKRKIIDTLWAPATDGTAPSLGFSALWGVDADRMDAMTYMYGIFTKDLPGYLIRPHTDDRMHVVQGMIYFIDSDDPAQSTMTYTSFDGDNPYRIPTGSGVGYFAANTNNSWHSGQNSSDQDRYSMVFGIRLNI